MNAVTLALVFVLAQGAPAKAPAKPTPTPSPAPTRVEPPPYEADLLRLAEMMGALAYLRDLCRDGDGAQYRQRIAGLIEGDSSPQETKDQIAGAFNRGFDGYRLTYRTCTDNARATIADYLAQSQKLAREAAARYGGG
jgi:uncharacterized protein (TIGR02301 family)